MMKYTNLGDLTQNEDHTSINFRSSEGYSVTDFECLVLSATNILCDDRMTVTSEVRTNTKMKLDGN